MLKIIYLKLKRCLHFVIEAQNFHFSCAHSKYTTIKGRTVLKTQPTAWGALCDWCGKIIDLCPFPFIQYYLVIVV